MSAGPQIIGAGFGRTGTTSLRAALEHLGYSPCYHMDEYNRRPDHETLWRRAIEEGDTDWEQLLGGYRAAVDWPVCSFWHRLAEVFPDARVVLTVRDPDGWYESMQRTVVPVTRLGRAVPDEAVHRRMELVGQLIFTQTFSGRFAHRDHALEVFRAHIRQVTESLPGSRVLVFDVAEGWGPLCEFLDRPIPGVPFPRLNDTATFQAAIWGSDRA